jgi:rod shape-determining protein MreC
MMFFCAVDRHHGGRSRMNYLHQFRQAFIAALHPLEVVASTQRVGTNIREYFTSHSQLIQDNNTLKLEAVEHKVMLQRCNTIEAENAHLRSLLNGNAPIIPKAILAEILHMGRDPFSNVIVINRGSQHNLKPGQAAVDANGVIGQITSAFIHLAARSP